jgi:hypothetical protein
MVGVAGSTSVSLKALVIYICDERRRQNELPVISAFGRPSPRLPTMVARLSKAPRDL